MTNQIRKYNWHIGMCVIIYERVSKDLQIANDFDIYAEKDFKKIHT